MVFRRILTKFLLQSPVGPGLWIFCVYLLGKVFAVSLIPHKTCVVASCAKRRPGVTVDTVNNSPEKPL